MVIPEDYNRPRKEIQGMETKASPDPDHKQRQIGILVRWWGFALA